MFLTAMLAVLCSVPMDIGAEIRNFDAVATECSGIVEQEPVKTQKVSYYGHGDNFHGKLMANGKKMDKNKFTAASPLIKGTNKPKYKLGTRLLLINPANEKSVEVVITDTGGFRSKGRELDLSYISFIYLFESHKKGIGEVIIITLDDPKKALF